ncbi:MAG TPA: SBBP repeat-containing protein [Bryobacteraceae bacterium]|nr:SBBP repeat-containing protein [Bryobacteraceae bacterium]
MRLAPLLFLLACALLSAATDYTTYIGDGYTYRVTALATDAAGNTYVTGSRSVIVGGSGGVALNDVFVSKLDPSGGLTLLATIGGKASDQANGIAVDPAGNIYIVGSTSSPNFPLHHPLQSAPSHGPIGGTGFLVKFSGDGTVFYSTYLGGTAGYSSMNAVAADAQGNAYVTGQTFASDYPRTPGLPAGTANTIIGGVSAAFFAKISPAGDKIIYAGGLAATGHACGAGSSCFLSTLPTWGTGIALDGADNAYICGNTGGTGLPATVGALRTEGIGAFAARVNAAGTGLGYLTLFGSANYIQGPSSNPGNLAYAITADAAGNAFIAGLTKDPDFPATPGSFQPKLSLASPQIDPVTGPPSDGFIAKLNPTGTSMVWASFLGGIRQDDVRAIATDSAGDVWVSGTTQSVDFPVSMGFPNGGEFLAELNASGSSLLSAARYSTGTVGTALAIDAQGVVHAAGDTGLISTLTPGQISSARLFGVTNAAGGELSGRVAPGELISLYGLHLGPEMPSPGAFDPAGFLPTMLAGVQVSINGTPAPLLYVSENQINAVAPLELVSGAPAVLRVTRNGAPLPDFRLVVDPVAPQVFRNADGSAAAINEDGSINSAANPAKVESFVSIWATGIGSVDGRDGEMATAAQPLCSCIVQDSRGQTILPSYAGAAPGMVTGVVQINFRVTDAGLYRFSVGSKLSDPFEILVTP